MRVEIVKEPDNDTLATIDRFLEEHSAGNYFQSSVYFELLSSGGACPFYILAWANDEVQGVMLATIECSGKRWFTRYMSRRSIVEGGPICISDDARISCAMLRSYRVFINSKVIYSEIRNFSDRSMWSDAFARAGWTFEEHLNFLVKINSRDEVWRKLSKSRKNQINKSQKNGATIAEATSSDDVEQFYWLLRDLYKNVVKKPLPGLSFFQEFFEISKRTGKGKIFIICQDGEIIGGIVCPIFAGTIYEWYVCGLDGQHKNIYPSVLATWAPIQYALDHNLIEFDFMGAGRPGEDYGVRDFKAKFGGDLVCYGRFINIMKPLHFLVAKLGLKLLGGLQR